MANVVVITGADAGGGRATVRECTKRGDWVGLIDRDGARLEEAAVELRDLGVRAHAAVADIADADAIERAADEITEALGPIDIWVNNALATVFSPVETTTAEEFQRGTHVTYLGTVHGTMAALRTRAAGPPSVAQGR